MEAELKSLRIDRSKKRQDEPSGWAKWWIIGGLVLLLLLGGANFLMNTLNKAAEVEVVRVKAVSAGEAARTGEVVLNATGYIVAAHKIQLAAKPRK
jgi:HlyD family secretion protein